MFFRSQTLADNDAQGKTGAKVTCSHSCSHTWTSGDQTAADQMEPKCSPHPFCRNKHQEVLFPWRLSYSLESQKVLSSLMPPCEQSDFLGLGMFHVTFILRSHVWRQLGSVNEQATALRSARPLSSVQNKGNILGCGSHNTKETLEPWGDPQWERSYFSTWLGTKCQKRWSHWLHITSCGQKVEIIQTHKKTYYVFPTFYPSPRYIV